ncbi:MAG: hypothetical protein ACE5KK_04450 [Candidatus Brocadiales bacterium]
MTVALLEHEVEATSVLEDRLQAFSDAVETHDYLEIDGDIEGDSLGSHKIKVLNHKMKTAYAATLEAILKQELSEVTEALETGVRAKLYGITRIVGYYSRTSNWNKSKLGELKDRHKGNYSVRAVA